MLFRRNNEKIPETIPNSIAWHLWKRKLWVWSGMANDELKTCGTHFNPGLLVRCVMPEVCFAVVQAESGWLHVLVSRQCRAPVTLPTIHHPRLANHCVLRAPSKNAPVAKPLSLMAISHPTVTLLTTDWLRQARILGTVPVRYMNDRYQSRVLCFNTKRVVCPTYLLQWISVNGFFLR